MDKLIYQSGKSATITNDGATIIKNLNIVHPAAKTLADISISQDDEVGDGTTSVVLLAAEFLKEARGFVEDSMHSRIIIKGYRDACQLALTKIKELEFNPDSVSQEDRRMTLVRCARTALNSKLVSAHKDFFAELVVRAVMLLDEDLDQSMIGIKHVKGGSVANSFLVDGVAFKKTFSYAGFEQQPKKFESPKIILLNLELELKAEKENAEVRIERPEDYQSIVDAEWSIIYDKLEKIHNSGAQIVLSRLPIGDLATQYFADRGVFCAGRVPQDDLQRVAKATGAQVLTTVNNIPERTIGECGLFEEVQLGNERYNLFKDCPNTKTATLVLRGGAEQYIEEAERSLHDAIMIVRRSIKTSGVVAGGGAIEMELSKFLREYSRTISGKQQLVINGFAKALEVIPRTLAENAGYDSVELLNRLRQKHATDAEGKWYGVDINAGAITDNFEAYVWEPTLVKFNALSAATEAACMILSVDETVRNPKDQQGANAAEAAVQGRARPRRMRGRGGRQ